MPSIAGLQYLLVLFVTLNFHYEFETTNQPEFEPGSPGPKAARLTKTGTINDFKLSQWSILSEL